MCLFCFNVLSCECIFLCVLCCLMFIVMSHIQLQLMQRLVLYCECIFLCLVLSDVYCHVPYSDAIDAETGSLE